MKNKCPVYKEEVHPWTVRYHTGDEDDNIEGLWCPYCGAIAYRLNTPDTDTIYGIQLPKTFE